MRDFDDKTLRTYEMLGTRVRILRSIIKATRDQRHSNPTEPFEDARLSLAAELARLDSAGSIPLRIYVLSCPELRILSFGAAWHQTMSPM